MAAAARRSERETESFCSRVRCAWSRLYASPTIESYRSMATTARTGDCVRGEGEVLLMCAQPTGKKYSEGR